MIAVLSLSPPFRATAARRSPACVDIIGSGSLRACVVLQDEIDREITSWHRLANSRDETATSPPLSLNMLHLASSRAAIAVPISPSPMIPLGASACIGATIAVQFQPLLRRGASGRFHF